MSKSLKQLAYDTIEAHQETIADLREQLAKANERVAELEKSNKSCGVAIRQLIAKGEIGPLLVTGDELDEIVNKFAIEKKVEGVNWFSENYCDDEHSFLADKAIEQLRKEQE